MCDGNSSNNHNIYIHQQWKRHNSYSVLTSALHVDKWSASRPDRSLAPGMDPRYPLDRRLGGPQSWSEHRG
jgi:hypothetical protein